MAMLTSGKAPSLEVVGMTKRFGSTLALDGVGMNVQAGSVHALIGENGAGKSTLAKCIIGLCRADAAAVHLNGRQIAVGNPLDARGHGIGMVHQHFSLAPSLTAAESLIINRADVPAVIGWAGERRRLEAFLAAMPLRVPLDRPVARLAAGEKQKLEILKLLYLDQRMLILDEPTSVLTPAEADEILGLLKGIARRGDITVVLITHRLRDIAGYADAVTVLRRGRNVGTGKVGSLSTEDMVRLMIGDTPVRQSCERRQYAHDRVVLGLVDMSADGGDHLRVIDRLNLEIRAGEIVGIAGVSGNGQSELVEVLFGQRPLSEGGIFVRGERFVPTRRCLERFKVFGLQEEPQRNAVVPRMTVAETMALRAYDKAPLSRAGWLSLQAMRRKARGLIEAYHVETTSPDAPIESLSGGNVQRVVLARELSGNPDVLIVANPTAGLDFAAAAETRAGIMEHRNRGAAVLLVSEDLDEVLELADRVAVMSQGRIAYLAPVAGTDRATVARHMVGK
jgi:general nucleoside transport system ATP-binding protein